MKVLVACEFSGIVRDSLIKKGHQAISCDLLPSESSFGKHIQGNVEDLLQDSWDMLIAFPPCTYLTVSGAAWFYNPADKHLPVEQRRPHPLYPNRRQQQEEALDFVRTLLNAPIEKIAIENPVGVISTKIRKPDQIIQPYMFGHSVSKKTCLWLKNLPLLEATKIVEPEFYTTKSGERRSKFDYDTSLLPHKERSKARSKTFPGIAEAMANQWG